MALTPEQRRVQAAFQRAIRQTGATRKPAKALEEAGLVESNLQNLPYGDRDSLGALQQRPSSGYRHAQNPYLAALDFLKQAIPLRGKYASAGQLAQAVQRSAFPARYDQRSGQANALLGGGYAGGSPSIASTSTAPDNRTQIALSLLGMGNLAGGYGGTDPLTQALLQAAQGQRAPRAGAGPPYGGASASLLGRSGKLIGTPYQGTHAKAFNVQGGSDNWQSENAVDIAVPVGTPVYAAASGSLGNTGSLGQGGRFAGLRTNLIAKGQSFYYAHLSKLAPGIRAGARVQKGQLLGYTGQANGVAHLHLAVEHGDPRRYVR